MKKDLITEINRVNELMGGKTLLSEQPIPKLLNLLFKTQSDDAVELIVRKSVKNADEAADILRRVKNGDELSKELAEKLLKDTGTMRLLANTLIDGTVLGVKFTNSIEKLVKDIVKDPKSYDESIEIFSKKLDDASVKAEWPDGLADEMMESIKKKVDDALKNKVDDIDITDIDINDIMNQASKKVKDVNNIDDFKSALKGFLTENRGRLTPMFTSRDIDRYIEEITGQLDVILSKGKNSKKIKNIENLWVKLPLSQKEKFAKEAIEKITKKLPLNLKNAIGNPRKFIDRIIKGSNGKFEWSVFWGNLKGIYFKAVLFQVIREIWKVTKTRADQKSGYKIGYDGWVESLLDGRSYEEFIAGIVVPPVEWIASSLSWADTDTIYNEIREMLPPSYRDNFYRERNGPGMFIELAGIKYPVYVKDNTIFVNIEENNGVTAYKLEDIEF